MVIKLLLLTFLALPVKIIGSKAGVLGPRRRGLCRHQWTLCVSGVLIMVESDIRTVRMPGRPITAGILFGAGGFVLAPLLFPALWGGGGGVGRVWAWGRGALHGGGERGGERAGGVQGRCDLPRRGRGVGDGR